MQRRNKTKDEVFKSRLMKRELGISLVEMMLVLALGGFLLVAGLRQYMSYRYDADVTTLKYNINTLMAGMLNYFQTNCGGTEGTLSPYNTKTPLDLTAPAFPIDIQKDLINNKFVETAALLHNALVLGYPTTDVPAGYQARFRLINVTRYQSITDSNNNTYAFPNTGKVLLWIPEIMVMVRDPKQIAFLKGVSGAKDCVDTSWAPNSTCAGAPALLYSQQVSFTNSKESGSNYWILNATANKFRQDFESYNPMVIVSGNLQNQSFYVCGS